MKIDVTFTEEDRREAEPYDNITDCLVCTALRRMGYDPHSAGGYHVRMDGGLYVFDPECGESNPALHIRSHPKPDGPHYEPSVVGLTLTLIGPDGPDEEDDDEDDDEEDEDP